jgi:hypothetical protein
MKHDYLLSQTGYTDHTPVWFDVLELTTVEHAGGRSVKGRMTGTDMQRFTLMLAVTADGYILPPFVIFRSKLSQNTNFHQELL